ncbi:hypothetical protein ADIARSV_0677 [Arcticibacter svalbardensis MN12-7]|uniref:Uncharacterized protein n=1 Tax=Arcticibacter svalbardensis MN12-7 TaxID=1150600 RepID=R9H4U1_9SPHI|nr:hypothetical protein [Arcticibacter svalbardensis]EOR96164.1 hypothetical protein ADIARSV_0677 [Arcticibacter svalbardensis MN12-7]
MKQLAYIYFILYFFIGGKADADVHDLLKISNLVEHVKEYLNEKPDSSILEFIQIHYGAASEAADNHKKDHDEHDEDLPFQSHTCCHTLTFYVISYFDGVDFKFYPINRFDTSHYTEKTPPLLARTIWQPPQISA